MLRSVAAGGLASLMWHGGRGDRKAGEQGSGWSSMGGDPETFEDYFSLCVG